MERLIMADDPPFDLDVIKKNAKLFKALQKFCKREFSIENLDFYFDNSNEQKLFETYITSKPKGEVVNLPGEILNPLRDLAKASDWKGMKPLMAKGKGKIQTLLQNDTLNRFYGDSKEYKDYLKVEKMGNPAKAAKLLGIKDVGALEDLMEAVVLGEDAKARAMYKKLELQEKYDEMIKILEKAGLG